MHIFTDYVILTYLRSLFRNMEGRATKHGGESNVQLYHIISNYVVSKTYLLYPAFYEMLS